MHNSLKIKNIMFHTGFMKLVSRLFQKKKQQVAILRYHAVADPDKNYYASPSIALALSEFEDNMRYLSQNYNVISLDDAAVALAGRRHLPDRAVVLTFDDGYKDNFSAYRIMKKYNVHGTFYITAGCIGNEGETLWLFEVIYLIMKTAAPALTISVKGKETDFSLESAFEKKYAAQKITEIIKSNGRDIREDIRGQLRSQIKDVPDFHEKAAGVMLNWKEIQEMSDNGMTIGGHTMTHLNLPNAGYKDAVYEICESKKLIEKKIGKLVRHFSYPNGGNYDYYNEIVMNIVKDAGYTTATTSNNGTADLNSDLFELNRIRITPNFSEVMYQMEFEGPVDRILGRN